MGILNLFNKKSASEAKGKIEIISPSTFRNAVEQKGVQLVDVRTPAEVNEGKIKNASHVDFFSPNFQQEIMKLNPKETVYIYCRSGNRSQKAAKVMLKLGFEHIIDLEGGYMNY